MEGVAEAWDRNRADLLRFLRRLLVRPELAEDIVQKTGLRALSAESAPAHENEMRPWLFRIASNLAIDELRRQGTWSETALIEARGVAEDDEAFVDASLAMRATADVALIANEHLAFCFSCTLRTLAPHRAASLLLAEVYGFTVRETAAILDASPSQAKNWLQEARAALDSRYARTCALINKKGVCYQCSELASFFNGGPANPLGGTEGSRDDRLRVVRATEEKNLSTWHRRLLGIIEDRRLRPKD